MSSLTTEIRTGESSSSPWTRSPSCPPSPRRSGRVSPPHPGPGVPNVLTLLRLGTEQKKGYRTARQATGWQIDSLESIRGLLTSLNIPSLAEYAGKGKQKKISMGLFNFSSLLHWGALKQSNLNQPENCGVNLARQVCSSKLSPNS